MKKAASLFLVLMLALSLCASSAAEAEIPGTVEIPYAGIRFVPPETYRDTAGVVSMEGAMEISDGIYFTMWSYYAMTDAERTAYLNDHNPDAPAEYRICPLFYVLSIGRGMTFKSFNALMGNSIPAEYVREIGTAGDYTFCLYMEGPNQDFIDAIDSPYKEEYMALASAVDDVAAAFTCFVPGEKIDPFAGLVGQQFVFSTTDLDGNPVSSAELFSQNEITLLNLWTSWCGPCIGELEDLQALHVELQEKGCGVMGMLLDDDLETARQLIKENGVAYPVLLGPEGLEDFLPVESVPTTLLVGRDGTVLAAPIEGAYMEKYIAALDALGQ